MTEQVRLPFTAGTHAEKTLRTVTAHGEHVVFTDKDIELADLQFTFDQIHRLDHSKQRIAILFDLRALVAVMGILHRQLVQAEFLPHHFQLGRLGIFQRHPDEAIAARNIVAYFLDWNVGQFPAFFVGSTIDQHKNRSLETATAGHSCRLS